jgi:hypothetical protein
MGQNPRQVNFSNLYIRSRGHIETPERAVHRRSIDVRKDYMTDAIEDLHRNLCEVARPTMRTSRISGSSSITVRIS